MKLCPRDDRWQGWVAPALLVWAICSLPFVRGMLGGQSFYFRDLSRQFLPMRLFELRGLLNGHLRFWNPLVHEGEAIFMAPLSYLPDALQLLSPTPWGVSLVLALHVPLAGLAFLLLARALGLTRTAAVAGGVVYALGGFCLSCLNLYVYLHAMAWAPLVILALLHAASGGRRAVAVAALLVALIQSTLAVELVAQVLLASLALALPLRGWKPWLRLGTAVGLGVALAGYPIAVALDALRGSARAAAFPTSVVLAHSVHPMTLVQTMVAGLYGDLAHMADRWWGQNFFSVGFPYVLSLYLGLTVLAAALIGLRYGRQRRGALAALLVLGLVVCLGRYAGLAPLVDLLPPLKALRYPTKAFFTVHLAVALLAALGLDALCRSEGARTWRGMAAVALALGCAPGAAWLLPWVLPRGVAWFIGHFFPSGLAWQVRVALFRGVLVDAATGGLLAVAAGLVALAVLGRRLEPRVGTLAIAALIGTDLLRAGAGLNPTVTSSFFNLSPSMSREAERIRSEGGRVLTCDPDFSRSYFRGRAEHEHAHEVWTFAVNREVFSPYFNLAAGVPSALSRDLTMLVPPNRTLPPEHAGCLPFAEVSGLARRAGVANVVSLDVLDSPDLVPQATETPRDVAPLAIHVYRLVDPLPLREVARRVEREADRVQAENRAQAPGFQATGGVAVESPSPLAAGATGRIVSDDERPGHLAFDVASDGPTVLVVRDAWAPGWRATLDGVTTPVLRADGRHLAVAIPRGRSRVILVYRPPDLWKGVALSLAAMLGMLALLWPGYSSTPHPIPPHVGGGDR